MSAIPSVPNLLTAANKTNTPEPDKLVAVVVETTTTHNTSDALLNSIKDITFNLVLNIPGLRAKLNDMLNHPNMVINEIRKIYDEIQSKIPESEMSKIRNYVAVDASRTALTTILQKSFQEIMADGKIDISDATHFLNLIFNIITMFNESSHDSTVSISGEAVMFFLYFVIKCVLVLCLNGEEETVAVGLLDTGFKLVSISVMPLTKVNCSCNPFQCWNKK
jgi:hypothetical protein